ncbi:MAG: hypothetical protein EG825_15525 [Rhodocyclaceae bacterium]|nr:hypothetical protein [Rhodocyclaceae bacterium]
MLRFKLDTSPALATLLAQFAAATDRATQMGMMDAILKAWGATSTLATPFTGAYDRRESPWDAGHALTVNLQNVTPGSDA